MPFLRGGGERSIRDPAEVARNLAYGFTTPRLVFELGRVVDRARAAAPTVSAPTLVVQSRQDNRIPPEAAERAFTSFHDDASGGCCGPKETATSSPWTTAGRRCSRPSSTGWQPTSEQPRELADTGRDSAERPRI